MLSFFFFKQKTAYELRISDWISDVCSSDLIRFVQEHCGHTARDLLNVKNSDGLNVLMQRKLVFSPFEIQAVFFLSATRVKVSLNCLHSIEGRKKLVLFNLRLPVGGLDNIIHDR